jgi:molybdate transport system ATP-binding protein
MLALELSGCVGALDVEVSLEIPAGRCLALAGPSGAGKTTLLRGVAGLWRPARGRIACDGETWLDTGRGTDVPPEERRCGYLFQEYALFPRMSAERNVAYGLRGMPRGERRSQALALLERFGVGHLARRRPAGLSGGERQRVALARTLARRPRALLLDEPLAALDAGTRVASARELGALLREAGVPTLLVTHDFDEAALLGDEVGVIAAGRVVQRGAAAELAARPASAFVADFTGAVVLTGTARSGEEGLTLVELDGGGTVASVDRRTGRVAASVYPWEISLEPAGAAPVGSARNALPAEVVSLTEVGTRVRVGLAGPQPMVAEITSASAGRLGLERGSAVTCVWKAAATRLAER